MMSASKEVPVQLSFKVMISKEKDKVLFAEADSDFVDVLLRLPTFPLGKILKLAQKHHRFLRIGSLTDLYNGLSNLDSVYFSSEDGKHMLLDPESPFEDECRELKLNLDDSEPAENLGSKKKRLKTTTQAGGGSGGGGGVFSEKTISFLISDDLRVVPIVQGSIIQPLSDIGITDIAKAEMRTVTVGLTQILDLVGERFSSDTPLTNVVIGKEHDYGRTSFQRFKCLRSELMLRIRKEASMNFKKMAVKAVLKKSTNWLLFVLAKEDFVDFLFNFLTLSLASVERLFNKNAVLAIDNLYRSAARLNTDKNTPSAKARGTLNRLMKPVLPPKFMSRNSVPAMYMKGPAMFVVRDDLTVMPLSLTSSLTVLNKWKIPLSEVRELEVQVGMEEVLSILKASLMSPCALTNGLINPILKKGRN